jgi:BlaI family penicillinase repressor
MEKQRVHKLGDLQLKIMRILWKSRKATVSEVHESLAGEKDLAHTTIATMLRKMEQRGLVRHRTEGRTFIYESAVEEGTVTRKMADDLVERLFAGSLTDAVSHLISNREVSRSELAQLEKLIKERKAKS